MEGDSSDAGKDPGTDETVDRYVAEKDEIADGLSTLVDPRTFLRRQQIGLLSLVLLAVLPLGTGIVIREIWVIKLTYALYFAVFVMSWDVVSGYTGQISFGHALFFGVGGYTSGMLNFHLGMPPVLSILIGAVMAAIAGLIIGVPALRTRGPYLSLITLIAPIILLRAFVFFSDITGGETGLVGVEKITFATLPNYYIAFSVFLFALAVFLVVTRSDAGSVFTAIREDEDAVGAAGLNPAKFKVFAFVLSAAVGGLAGAVLVHSNVGSVSPNQILSLVISIEVIIAAIFGGMGTITGAAIGGFLFFLLQDWLRGIETVIPVIGVPVGELDLLIFGVVILGFIFFMPEGILRRMIIWGHRIRSGSEAENTEPISDGGRTPLRATVEKFVRELRHILRGDDR